MAQGTSGWGRRPQHFLDLTQIAEAQAAEEAMQRAQAEQGAEPTAPSAAAPAVSPNASADVDESAEVSADEAPGGWDVEPERNLNRAIRRNKAPANAATDAEIKAALHAEYRARQTKTAADGAMQSVTTLATRLEPIRKMAEQAKEDLVELAAEKGFDSVVFNDPKFDLDSTAQTAAAQRKTGALHDRPFTRYALDVEIAAIVTSHDYEGTNLGMHSSDQKTGTAVELAERAFREISEKFPDPTIGEQNALRKKEGLELLESDESAMPNAPQASHASAATTAGAGGSGAASKGANAASSADDERLREQLSPALDEISSILQSHGYEPLELKKVGANINAAHAKAAKAQSPVSSTPAKFARLDGALDGIFDAAREKMNADHDELRRAVGLSHVPSADRIKETTLAQGTDGDKARQAFFAQRAERLAGKGSQEHPDQAAVERRIAYESELFDYQSALVKHDAMTLMREQFGLPATAAPKVPKLLADRLVDALRTAAAPNNEARARPLEMDLATNARFATSIAQIEAGEKALGPFGAQREAATATLAQAREAHLDAIEQVEHLTTLLPGTPEERERHVEALRREVRVEGGYNLSPSRVVAEREALAARQATPAVPAQSAQPIQAPADAAKTVPSLSVEAPAVAPQPAPHTVSSTPVTAQVAAQTASVAMPVAASPEKLSQEPAPVKLSPNASQNSAMAAGIERAPLQASGAAPTADANPANQLGGLARFAERRSLRAHNGAAEQSEGEGQGKQQSAASAAAPKPSLGLEKEADAVIAMGDDPKATAEQKELAELSKQVMESTQAIRAEHDQRWTAARAQRGAPLTEDQLKDPIAQSIRADHPEAVARRAGVPLKREENDKAFPARLNRFGEQLAAQRQRSAQMGQRQQHTAESAPTDEARRLAKGLRR
ncbi:hypothetical protein [Burkholderia pseudomallei]|uniref:hypothetical protein n=1 Tax=Burkholderia pseudomallei TaxID=28450 RepID=UPI000F08475D|nr:hypothetical protein [Burkholderia pseudomallei]CAJ3073117.1 Uncharacterised protein [Burkholderia pseudomallei]VCK72850.1 Uncharacterised protein [Burkholderia pseudomallei]VCK79997.1 Uncharacterised protein [Burkholderia pseudomallei]VCK80017.1 Uncharacterised protein [Burkholderia pseudomallei]VCK80782.1 Uncharacterised protein [Burkholderia pseudomallei]